MMNKTSFKEPVEKKTFELPINTARRLKLSAAITGEFERNIVDEAINKYLDELKIPRNINFKK